MTTMDEQGRHQVHNTVERAVWMVSIRHRRRCRSRTARFFTIFLRKSNAARTQVVSLGLGIPEALVATQELTAT